MRNQLIRCFCANAVCDQSGKYPQETKGESCTANDLRRPFLRGTNDSGPSLAPPQYDSSAFQALFMEYAALIEALTVGRRRVAAAWSCRLIGGRRRCRRHLQRLLPRPNPPHECHGSCAGRNLSFYCLRYSVSFSPFPAPQPGPP